VKRSPLQRKAPLRRVAMSPRRTPLRRSTKRLGLWPPARPRVTREERRAREVVQQRSEGRCEACCVEHPGTEWHHRVRRSQGGLWSASNGLWLCATVHAWITLNPHSARAKGWGLWSTEDPTAERVLYRGRWVLLTDDGSVLWPAHGSTLTTAIRDFPIGGAR
jgi:hypothetical protein